MCLWTIAMGYPMPIAPQPKQPEEEVRVISELHVYKFEWTWKWFYNKFFGFVGYFSVKTTSLELWEECTKWCEETLNEKDYKAELLVHPVSDVFYGEMHFRKLADALLFKMSLS